MTQEVYDSDENQFGFRTTRDLNSPRTKLDNKHPIYFYSDLKNKTLLFSATQAIRLIELLNCDNFTIKTKLNQNKTLPGVEECSFQRVINLISNDTIHSEHPKKVLRIYYDNEGTNFLFQLKNTSPYLPFERRTFQIEGCRKFQAMVLINKNPQLPNVPEHIKSNTIIRCISRYLNSTNNYENVDKSSAAEFAAICPPEDRTILKRSENSPHEEIEAEVETSNKEYNDDDVLKIATINVNSIAAASKKGFVEYIEQSKPDIFCIQETKLHKNSSPGFASYIYNGYYGYFYNSEQHKGYAGTAIYTRIKPISVRPAFNDLEGRVILMEFSKFYVLNAYVPNAGQTLDRLDYKINVWTPKLNSVINELSQTKPVILCGDLNVAHQPIDVYNTKGKEKVAGYTPQERKWLDDFINEGYTDVFRHLYPSKQQFTFFSYRFNMKPKGFGWRLDYFIAPTKAVEELDFLVDCTIFNTEFSDHIPSTLVLKRDAILTDADKPIEESGVMVLNSEDRFTEADVEEEDQPEQEAPPKKQTKTRSRKGKTRKDDDDDYE